ncbi:MAG: PAS domain S-box protein [Candidatus Acidulodesulfobacterium acidiphilum]|uniref:PAS domain S-box protein n=1 Tax=Candidatus Acidulodesulfobacterium acidiphilum TaxID=2597224 RepID=A0A520XGX1_9DELT|nr:MAG: PAS domain S-box protein [Candidatus Acidulodesulfobacterium acidiphilum]
MKTYATKDYSAFDKLLCPILAINANFNVIFLNKTAEEVYKTDNNCINKFEENSKTAGSLSCKCYKISHGYDIPCYELKSEEIRCPIKELKENKDINVSNVIHNHKGYLYKVEAFRDDSDSQLFFESHTNITEFISEIDIVKKAKEKAESSEKRIETFFENIPVPTFIIDIESGVIVNANKKAVEFYGYSKEEFKNMTVRDINPFISDNDLKNYRKQALKEGLNHNFFKHRLKNGDIKDVESFFATVNYNGKTYILRIVVDITEKKILEDKLKESEETFRIISENIPIGIDIHKEKFIYANPALLNMLGCTQEELKGKFSWEFFSSEYYKELQESIEKGLSDIGHKYSRTDKIIKKSGEELWIYLFAVSVRYKGEIVRVASWTDITEQVNLRKSLEQERNIFKVLIENINSGIALYDKDKLLYVNSALLDLLGLTKEELIAGSPFDIFRIDETQLYSSSISLFNMHHTDEFSSHFIYKYDKAGNIRYIDLFRTKVTYNGGDAGLAIFTDVTDQLLREQNMLIEKDKYKELSEIDSLTGIYNRRSMDLKLTELLNLAKRYERPFSIIMFDIDRFKNINDSCGHDTDDTILKDLAKLVKKELRNTDFFARYGGEEFMVLAPETPIETALELAERLRLKVQNHDFKIGERVTISLGVASLIFSDNEADLLKRVDLGLYKAKNAGRNLVGVV